MKEVLLLIALTCILYAEPYEKMKKECSAGESESCVSIGILYQLGKDIDQSYEKANIYYSMACELNSSYGCLNLGHLYYLGQGVDQNNTKAKFYYDKACKLSNVNGCDNFKSLVDEDEELRQKKIELEHLKQEQQELIQEAEVLDNI
ncbi:MAG: tetratricopeptide repeat protein [Campylobacterota bacterium]|nr:tetratricopeptide repeat protein [Campylobacterota bacterium]